MNDFDIIVVGGGLVGATFTLDMACKNPNLKIGLLEPKPVVIDELSSDLDNKIYAISPHNLDYLTKIGGMPTENRMGIISKMNIFGDNDSNLVLDAKSINRFYLAKTIESANLQQYLYQKLNDLLNVHLIYGCIESIKVRGDIALVKCSDQEYRSKLVVGSDGANSIVRQSINVKVKLIDYEARGVVANFACELPHNNIAYQWFNRDDVLAYLPLPGNQISIVWSHANYQELMNANEDVFSEMVANCGQYKLGKLKLITRRAAFPLKLYLVDKLYSNRIVLIGDAAHTIHPLAGQGVNLGFADAEILVKILSGVKPYQLGDESLLAKYNAIRQPLIRQMQFTCHGLHRLFNTDDKIISKLRNVGLNLVGSLPIVKKYLINNAIKY